MTTNGKFLYQITVKGRKKVMNQDLEIGVYGIFHSEKIEPWTYYAIAYQNIPSFTLLPAIGNCGFSQPNATNTDISKTGVKFETEREARKYIDDFKIKWEIAKSQTRKKNFFRHRIDSKPQS